MATIPRSSCLFSLLLYRVHDFEWYAGVTVEERHILSQESTTIPQCLLQFVLIFANVKVDGLASIDITSKVALRDSKALALCNEAGEPGDGDGGAVGGGQGADLEFVATVATGGRVKVLSAV